jgi:hypothetical protein
MNRRDFLKKSAAIPFILNSGSLLPLERPTGLLFGKYSGPTFYDISGLDGFGKGKQAFLCNAYKKVTGETWQTKDQLIGDCVGMGTITAMDFLTTTQTLQRKTSWKGNHSVIAAYLGGREMAGKYPFGNGASTEWLINFLKEYGVLLKKKYGPDDISKYSMDTYYAYKRGISENLKIHAKEHPVLHAELVKSYEVARDAIAAGFPVIIASKMGISRATKDKDGFFYPRGYAAHCMCLIGVDDKERPSCLIQNSHGPNWAPGPKRYGFEPEGSAWVDAEYIDKYVGSYNDSWTISMFRGYKVKRKYVLW